MRDTFRLEDELQSELQNARVMSRPGTHEVAEKAAIWVSNEGSRVSGVAIGSIATRRAGPTRIRTVPTSRASAATNVTPLGMVEDVERFGTELERCAFLDGEMLENRHIKINLMWIARNIPGRIAEGESLGRGKGPGIHQ